MCRLTERSITHRGPYCRAKTRQRRVEDEALRRRQLIDATVDTIASLGFSAATLAEIAKRAGLSTGLVAFHFGDKDGLLEATLRHLARDLSRGLADRLRQTTDPRTRLQAIIDILLADAQFDRRIATVWLAFWGQGPHSRRFARVQRVYHRRLATNLAHALRPLAQEQAVSLAESLSAFIDGLWLRSTLGDVRHHGAAMARATATAYLDAELAKQPSPNLGRRPPP